MLRISDASCDGKTHDGVTNAVTAENRPLVGFMNAENEYLVIAPEMVVDGEIRRVDAIGVEAFKGCRLRTVVLLDGFREVRADAFANCTSLKEIVIPEGVTTIGEYAFGNCTALTEAIIPEGVTVIEEYAFLNCIGLGEIRFGGTCEQWKAAVGDVSIGCDARIVCSDGTLLNF